MKLKLASDRSSTFSFSRARRCSGMKVGSFGSTIPVALHDARLVFGQEPVELVERVERVQSRSP